MIRIVESSPYTARRKKVSKRRAYHRISVQSRGDKGFLTQCSNIRLCYKALLLYYYNTGCRNERILSCSYRVKIFTFLTAINCISLIIRLYTQWSK